MERPHRFAILESDKDARKAQKRRYRRRIKHEIDRPLGPMALFAPLQRVLSLPEANTSWLTGIEPEFSRAIGNSPRTTEEPESMDEVQPFAKVQGTAPDGALDYETVNAQQELPISASDTEEPHDDQLPHD